MSNSELPDFTLNNHVAIVSGAGSGIGLAVTGAYLRAGSKCLACDIKKTDGITALMKKHAENLLFAQCDVTDTAQIQNTVATCVKHFGKVTILFNNAAIFDLAPLHLSDESMYDRLFAVNVKGMFFFMREATEKMKDNGFGKVINMASQAGRRGEALVSHYCATKAAVISYTQSAALALAPYKINVNAISPGVIDTPMWDSVDSLFAKYENLKPGEKKTEVAGQVPLGYMGTPGDIIGSAVFLASSASDYITAQTLNVDGGSVMN